MYSGCCCRWVWVCVWLLVSFLPSQAALPEYNTGIPTGQVENNNLMELSGMVASRNNPGILWVHNDGSSEEVSAIDRAGRLLGTYDLGENVTDFEDIARGPGPDSSLDYLYIGDIGDNAQSRNDIRVYRVPEPAVYGYFADDPVTETLRGIDEIKFTYPGGTSYDAEALLVDPWTGDLFIATKQAGMTQIFRASAAQLVAGGTIPLTLVRQLNFDSVSGGDISPDGRQIILRQEYYAQVWVREVGQSIGDALSGVPGNVPVIGPPTEPNGEAVTFAANSAGYYTVSEGSDPVIYFFARSNFVPQEPVSLIAPAAKWRYLDNGSDAGTAWRNPDFNDGTWALGEGQLGYGQGDQQTLLSYGPERDQKFVTTYFRHSFTVNNPERVASLTLRLLYDDGVAVFLNGMEVHRRNLAANATYLSLATAANTDLENVWQTFALNPQGLRTGSNTVAVEVHRRSRSEGDLSFDLQLGADVVMEDSRLVNPPRRLPSGEWLLSATGTDGTLTVQRSSDLRSWSDIGQLTITGGSGSFRHIPVGAATMSFYRLRR